MCDIVLEFLKTLILFWPIEHICHLNLFVKINTLKFKLSLFLKNNKSEKITVAGMPKHELISDTAIFKRGRLYQDRWAMATFLSVDIIQQILMLCLCQKAGATQNEIVTPSLPPGPDILIMRKTCRHKHYPNQLAEIARGPREHGVWEACIHSWKLKGFAEEATSGLITEGWGGICQWKKAGEGNQEITWSLAALAYATIA